MTTKPKAIIVDLDGTIADLRHRLHLVKYRPRTPHTWNEFFDQCSKDTPHEHICELLRALQGVRIIIVSGRPDSHRQVTIWWLRVVAKVPFDELHMRVAGDRTPDRVIKRHILEHLRKEYEIILAIDDRPSVIRMWKEEGVPVLDMCSEDWDEEEAKESCYAAP